MKTRRHYLFSNLQGLKGELSLCNLDDLRAEERAEKARKFPRSRYLKTLKAKIAVLAARQVILSQVDVLKLRDRVDLETARKMVAAAERFLSLAPDHKTALPATRESVSLALESALPGAAVYCYSAPSVGTLWIDLCIYQPSKAA